MTRTASGVSRRKTLPQLSIRIDLDSEGRIGPGKIRLLEQIGALGSISAAGRAMKMSYKRAWDLVEEMTSICGAVVQRHTGGRDGGGATLTPLGQSLISRYRRIEKAAAAAVRDDLAGLQSDVGRRGRTKRA